jgi:hypothetical protein
MRWRANRTAFFAVAAAACEAVFANGAHAADPPRVEQSAHKANDDTTYGRIEGDVAFVFGAGITVAPRAPRATLDARIRYLETVGLFFDYEDATIFSWDSEPRRVLAGGVEVRPLFLGRWLTGYELARGRLDLMLDSIGLELGGVLTQPIGASFSSRAGVQAGLGFEVPILAQATGPWLGFHGGVRWSDSAISDGASDSPVDRATFLSITLAWHQLVVTHIVDAGDGAPR